MGRRLLAAALLVLALTACGGKQAVKSHEPTVPETRWHSGLVTWSTSMTRAINGISVLFSHPVSVRKIEAGEHGMALKLRRLEDTLTGCAAAVGRLGPAPAIFAVAHHQALRACAALQQGSALIRAGVHQVQSGLGVELLTESSQALASGQDSVRRALLDLKQG